MTTVLELSNKLADVLSALRGNLPGPTTRPAFPDLAQNPPAFVSPLPTSRPARDMLGALKGYQELLKGIPTSQPSRAAVITALSEPGIHPYRRRQYR